MTANYVLLEKITVGAAGASSVTFSGIPQTGYTDLCLLVSARSSRSQSSDNIDIFFNGSTANRSDLALRGSGTVAVSYTTSNGHIGYIPAASDTANTFGSTLIYIPNYTSSTNKSFNADVVMENNNASNGGAFMVLDAGLWSQTAAITSITLNTSSGAGSPFVQYSTFYLYGVAKLGTTPAIVPYATGGDTIMTDGTYWYHAFTSSGTFTPAKGLSCDVLVVAGGGGGGKNAGGGGGAGGVYYSTSNSVGSAQTVTIGAGGAGGGTGDLSGVNGVNSQFGSLTAAVGGGGGAGAATAQGSNGGSGGGSTWSGSSLSGGTATSGQGNAGGSNANFCGGGGGGAGAAGGNANSTTGAGAGGAGTNTYSAWLSATGLGVSGYIAGGGGGGGYLPLINGAGGSGGGGAGAGTPTAGTVNTGGGGGANAGGASYGPNGAAGGSGLVIVRYAV